MYIHISYRIASSMLQPYKTQRWKYAYDRAKHDSTEYSCIRNIFALVCESLTHANRERDRWRSRRQPSSTLPRYISTAHRFVECQLPFGCWRCGMDNVRRKCTDTFQRGFLRQRCRNALFDLLFQWIFEVNWIYILISDHEYILMRLFWTQIIFIGVSKLFG